ncbi:MAG TPA: pitrilysin family protein [Longimicrobiales bacterium]|nr:pitrilysin family protein [Longimicrobiales bacterium]
MKFDRTTPPPPGAVRAFEFPAVRRSRLSGGMTVLHAEHGGLPLVTVRAVLDAGAGTELPGEEGLAWLTAHALEGGTERRGGEELAWELERLGTQLETLASWDGTHVGLSVHRDRLPAALDFLAEIVRTPAFPAREVERLRGEQLAEIMRRRTEPRGLADDAAIHFIYADEAAYSRTLLGRADRVAAFDAGQAAAFHRRRFSPGTGGLVVVGDVDAATALREAERTFGDWSGDGDAAAAPTALPRTDSTTVYLVDRPGAVQSELRIGHVGVPRHHEDYHALLVLNSIVGGAFTSRLNMSLRERHGFTYGVRSSFGFRRAAGPFVIQTAVASDVTARAVEETLREVRGIVDDGVTHDEVAAARDFLAGTFALGVQTTDQLAGRVADIHTFGLETDYFETHRERLGAVSRDDVVRAARSHLHLDRLAIVAVGNADAIADGLEALDAGPVVRTTFGQDAPPAGTEAA